MLKLVKAEHKSLVNYQPGFVWGACICMPSFAICYSSTEFCTSIWCCSFPIKQLHSILSYWKYRILHCCVFQSLFDILVRIQLGLFEKNGTNSVVLLNMSFSNLSAGICSTSMALTHSGLFHKGEKWNFCFTNNFLPTDVIMLPSWFWLNILSLDSALVPQSSFGSSK